MCLSVLTSRYPKTKCGFGWKVFRTDGKRLMQQCYTLKGDCAPTSEATPVGKWLSSTHIVLVCEDSRERYDSGFHIFLSRAGARRWAEPVHGRKTIRKVRYTHGHTIGKQDGDLVVIASRMRVLPREEQ